jgi:hypothetical protein
MEIRTKGEPGKGPGATLEFSPEHDVRRARSGQTQKDGRRLTGGSSVGSVGVASAGETHTGESCT